MQGGVAKGLLQSVRESALRNGVVKTLTKICYKIFMMGNLSMTFYNGKMVKRGLLLRIYVTLCLVLCALACEQNHEPDIPSKQRVENTNLEADSPSNRSVVFPSSDQEIVDFLQNESYGKRLKMLGLLASDFRTPGPLTLKWLVAEVKTMDPVSMGKSMVIIEAYYDQSEPYIIDEMLQDDSPSNLGPLVEWLRYNLDDREYLLLSSFSPLVEMTVEVSEDASVIITSALNSESKQIRAVASILRDRLNK